MTTSANVTEYVITKNDKKVGEHSQHMMCKTNWDKLLKFLPLKDFKIKAYGYDEEEAYWENEPINLEKYLLKIASGRYELKIINGKYRWLNNYNGQESQSFGYKQQAIIMYHNNKLKWKESNNARNIKEERKMEQYSEIEIMVKSQDCEGCGETFEIEANSYNDAKSELGKALYEAGWREKNSKYWALIGLFCDKCIADGNVEGESELGELD